MKKKLSRQKSSYSLARFKFTLPGHVTVPSYVEEKLRKASVHVKDDIYRVWEVKIEPKPATPLEGREEVEKMWRLYCSPPHAKNVVTASADAEKAIVALIALARSGNGKALWQLADLVKRAVAGVNEIAAINPDAIKPLARNCDRWPMMRSTAPHLCDDDKMLEKIELGKATGVQLDKFSKWKPDYAALVAYGLRRHVEMIRGENPPFLDAGKAIRFSKYLSPFSKDAAERWWQIAEKFLLATYPKPEEITELDALVTAKSKRKYPSSRREAILEKIRARFFHMAL